MIEKKKYSQNDEDLHTVNYFGDFIGTLLSVGENDGITFSNSKRLIELGWKAVLVEPSPVALEKLLPLYSGNEKVLLMPCCIGTENKTVTLHESGAHVRNGSDRALVSSVLVDETTRWKNAGVQFEEADVEMIYYATLCFRTGISKYDFISIDAEGMDLAILKQIDLSHTKLLCIEWNGDTVVRTQILNYCAEFDMRKIIYTSGENLLIGR